jgi:two-component system LytT family response regulator
MIRCVIIDDELPAIHVLKRYIERLPNFELVGFETNPLVGIELVKREKPDVVFLDIQMDELNGIGVAEILGDCTKIVFCTAYSEFAVTSYELDAVDYLMKPIEFNRFVKATQRVSSSLQQQLATSMDAIPNDYIYIKAGQKGKMIKIDLDDIDFVEAMGNYVSFSRAGEKTLAYLKLKDLESSLPGSQFMRVHRSFIVSLRQISKMENSELVLKTNGQRIPIGAIYKEVFLERMREKLMER